jgi:hypothetical protein
LFRLAHRAFCARLIFRRAAADIFRRVLVDLIDLEASPDKAEIAASSRPNSKCSFVACSLQLRENIHLSPSGWDCSKWLSAFLDKQKGAAE